LAVARGGRSAVELLAASRRLASPPPSTLGLVLVFALFVDRPRGRSLALAGGGLSRGSLSSSLDSGLI